MFFIHFQFKVAFRAPSRSAFPPPLLRPCGLGETFFGPCPKSVSAMNSNGFTANWQNFLCVCCKSRPQNCCYCFHLQQHAPTSPLPPAVLAYNCSNKPKKCKQITTQIVTSTQKSFFSTPGRGRDAAGGGRAVV